MNRYISIILLLQFIVLCCYGQKKLTKASFAKTIYEFKITENGIEGNRVNEWMDKLGECQFLLLGENHLSSQLGEFTSTLLKELSTYGFDHLALEVGPVSAVKLSEMSADPASTESEMKKFTKKYSKPRLFHFPIMFFQGVEDAWIIKSARQHSYDLWGLDQEFTDANQYLLDRLFQLSNHSKEVKRLRNRAVRRVKWLNLRKKISKGFNVSCRLLKDQRIQAYFDAFPIGATDSQSIIKALRDSWEIYCLYEQEKYADNNHTRAEYMKDNFKTKYQEAVLAGDSLPRVLVKLGNVHTTRGKSILGVNDIGNFIVDFAKENNTKALSIVQLRRYIQDKKGNIKDNLTTWGTEYKPLMEWSKNDRWVLVDLRPARKMLLKGELVSNKELTRYIHSYDMVLLSPLDRRVAWNL